MKLLMRKLVLPALLILSVIYILVPYRSGDLKESAYSDIDQYITAKMEELRIPGVSLGLIQGEKVYIKGYGSADSAGNRVTADTPFLLGSTTKSFTALAVMQLAEQGKIDPDEKVITYLPDFRFQNKELSDQITVRQLLNQTGGIAGPTGGSDYLDSKSSRKDFITELSGDTVAALPGSRFEYAEANYVILGEIITAVSGQSYESYMKEHIFIPLNMEHSYTNKSEAVNNGLARGHISWFGFPIDTNLPYPMQYTSASALYSSAKDLTHYIRLYLNRGSYNGSSILSPHGMDEIMKPSVPLLHPAGYSYGMGWFVNSSLIMHNGCPTNYYSILLIDPEANTGIVLLANANNRLITGEYIMPVAYDIMNRLTGIPPVTTGIGYRQLYRFINLLILWCMLFLFSRIAGTFTVWPKKMKSGALTVKRFIKSVAADIILLGLFAALFLYLLISYGVSVRIAYLGQPDIIMSLCIITLLPAINIVAKVCLFKKRSC